MKFRIYIFYFVLLCAVTIAAGATAQNKSSADEGVSVMPKQTKQLFNQYCYDCHDANTSEGGVDLESLPLDISQDLPTAELWSKVLGEINSGEMPPRDSDQLSDLTKAKFLRMLSEKMVTARARLSDSGGAITMRRLNRREYAKTMFDLLGVEPDVRDLPSDEESGDFDTVGANLFLSSSQIETYRRIAKETLIKAIERRPVKRMRERSEAEDSVTVKMQEKFDKYADSKRRIDAYEASGKKNPKAFGFGDTGAISIAKREYEGEFPQIKSYLDEPLSKTGAPLILMPTHDSYVYSKLLRANSGGKYKVRARIGAFPDADRHDRYAQIGFKRYNVSKILKTVRVDGTVEDPQIIEAEVELPIDNAGIQFFVRQRRYSGGATHWNTFWSAEFHNQIGPPPKLWVDWIEFDGPIEAIKPTPIQKLFSVPKGKRVSPAQGFRRKLTQFATEAFRNKRPDKSYTDQLMQIFEAELAESNFKNAVAETLSIVLASPSFLYFPEPHGEAKDLITERELAVRLSYLLWSLPPDDRLLRLADSGLLSDPKVLNKQLQRMMVDEKFDAFITSFVPQWLGMERLDVFQFPPPHNPYFDETLRESARNEVYETFATIIRNGMPLQQMIKSDFVVVDDVLIDFYELPREPGEGFRKISVADDSPRGGLLGMAAVHMMGSDGIHPSIVERGAWVLRHVLDDPPPPAPANVPQLPHSGKDSVKSARKLLAMHTNAPQCAQCHQKIDPIGWGMQNFNASGRWQETEPVMVASKGNWRKKENPHLPIWDELKINARGNLPNGKKFKNFFELREAIAKEGRVFSEKYAKDMIAFGLGRPYSFTDEPLLNEMMQYAARTKNRASSYIIALVRSKQFRTK